MALVELYRTTGDKRYLDFVHYLFTGEKLRLQLTADQVKYLFSGIPFTSRTEIEGHAVRALYACSGATDYYLETGDEEYHNTLDRLWQDLAERKMYITGGVGSYAQGEAVGAPYDLPNERAYAESCAAIANLMWNWRMLAASGDAKYADVMERALYNGINSGMSLSGTLYCYRNPLDSRGDEDIRQPWYDTTCCPPNLERTFASIPGYLYSTSPSGVYVNLYHSSTLDWHLENGTGLKLSQQTKYPWEGDIPLKVNPAEAATFTLYLRIPGWSSKATVSVDGKPAAGQAKTGRILRHSSGVEGWKHGPLAVGHGPAFGGRQSPRAGGLWKGCRPARTIAVLPGAGRPGGPGISFRCRATGRPGAEPGVYVGVSARHSRGNRGAETQRHCDAQAACRRTAVSAPSKGRREARRNRLT